MNRPCNAPDGICRKGCAGFVPCDYSVQKFKEAVEQQAAARRELEGRFDAASNEEGGK